MLTLSRITILGVAVLQTLGAQCTASWSETLGGIGTNGAINALAVFDDGNTRALVAAGSFTSAGGGAATRVAAWSSGKWQALGPGGPTAAFPLSLTVKAVHVHDDGSGPAVYVGGTFSSSGGVVTSGIARWNGSWSGVGGGGGCQGSVPPTVNAIASFVDATGPKLCIGGRFTSVGGVPANGIAMWNGTTWAPMALGFTQVDALAVFDDGSGPALHAAASVSIGPVTLDGVARWTGSSWTPVGGVVNGTVLELAVYDDGTGPALYAGGTFTSVGGVGASNVARWSGTQWSALGAGTDGVVRSLRAFDDGLGSALYVGGSFNVAGGVWSQGLARWKLNGWTAVGGGVGGGLSSVNALAVLPGDGGPLLVGGGSFTTAIPVAGAPDMAVANVLTWNGTTLGTLGGGMNAPVTALAAFDDGSGPALYASGNFKTAGGSPVRSLARRVPGGWAPLGPGFDAEPLALAAFDDGNGALLHAGGAFSTAGGAPTKCIARWKTGAWQPLSLGLTGSVQPFVHALRVFDDGSGPALYAGGQFGFAGTTAANNVAKWNGLAWYPLGAGLSGSVEALEVFDDGSGPALYAGGSFPGAVARWNGATWATVGGGLSGGAALTQVFALKTVDLGFGPRLAAGGDFSMSGGSFSDAAAMWDGNSWAPFAAPPPGSQGSAAGRSFAIFADANGPALTMGTRPIGYVPVGFPGLWRLGPAGWAGFGLTTSFPCSADALATFDDGGGPALWVGGSFRQVDSFQSSNIARFGPPSPTLSLTQPGGAGRAVLTDYDLVPGHEYLNVFSPDACPGPPGTGPYLGLCANDVNILIAQALMPNGAEPFHFTAYDRRRTFGPFQAQPGLTIDGICIDVTGGMPGCVSAVSRVSLQ